MQSKLLDDDILFKECIESLADNVEILSKHETDKIFGLFKKTIPIYQGGSRIDWDQVPEKIVIQSRDQTISLLEQLLREPVDTSIYVLWNDASLPIIKTDLNLVLMNFDDVTCVGFETWLYNPFQGYIIQYYYLGEMDAGIIPGHARKQIH